MKPGIKLPLAGQRRCAWLQTPLGAAIHQHQHQRLKAPIACRHGHRLAHIGCASHDLIPFSPIPHQLHISASPARADGKPSADLYADAHALPLDSQSIDVLILHHSLETSPQASANSGPHAVLREAERVLSGEGLLLILGFNPWCWWQLMRLRGHPYPKRDAALLSAGRISDWLQLLDLEISQVETFFSLPPVNNDALLQRLKLMQRLDHLPFNPLHALYLIHARKHIAPLTPTRLSWRDQRRLIAGGLAEPSIRQALKRDR